ncbi:MAG: helix-turn-helix transcriptional regulator [Candidatus Hodarchaeota archaeon]
MITNRIRELREHHMQMNSVPSRWTQKELAQRVDVSRQTIIAIEKGTYNPSLELAFKLSRVFNVSIEELFTYRGKEDET